MTAGTEPGTTRIDLRLGPGLVLRHPRHPPERGYVEIAGRRIHHVGPEPSAADARSTVPTRGCIIVPAFLNTHCHTSQQLGRGLADDVDLLTWLHRRIWPYELALTEEDSEVAASLCALVVERAALAIAFGLSLARHRLRRTLLCGGLCGIDMGFRSWGVPLGGHGGLGSTVGGCATIVGTHALSGGHGRGKTFVMRC